VPVYHFTFHAYGSWLPDHPKGYVRRDKGILPPDDEAAKAYRYRMNGEPVEFDEVLAGLLNETIESAIDPQRLELYAVGIDPTHVHVVVGWRDDRTPIAIRTQLKSSMTRVLNGVRRRDEWWTENASQKPVKDREHLLHLLNEYLPGHHRWYWRCV